MVEAEFKPRGQRHSYIIYLGLLGQKWQIKRAREFEILAPQKVVQVIENLLLAEYRKCNNRNGLMDGGEAGVQALDVFVR